MRSLLCRGVERLGHDADVGDASLFDGVHDGSESTEGDTFVGAQVDALVRGVGIRLAQACGDVCEVDGLVAEEDALVLVNGDDLAAFGDFLDAACFGTATSMPDCRTGAVSMKMTSSTSTTSTSGVMLISASADLV